MSPMRKIYFTSGPAKIPNEVMEQVHRELLDYRGLGISVMEMSHRSKEFEAIRDEAEANLRKVMSVPDNYAVLFMHGGAKTQFDSVPLNLCPELDQHNVEYIVSGSWSKMAATEAEKYAKVVRQKVKSDKFDRMLIKSELEEVAPGACYRYYCDNETIQGVEFNYVPEAGDVPLVCDMTSNFLSRPVDVSKFGIIFAGAQKNCGISGLTIVIIRRDLIGKHMRITPTVQNYKVIEENKSLYNTPLTFAIYIANLCFKWVLERGGLEGMDKLCRDKSQLLYDAIESSNGFYTCQVAKDNRSRMDVVFSLSREDLEDKFLEEAKLAGLHQLENDNSAGALCASLYHGITLEDTKRLVHLMIEFKKFVENPNLSSNQLDIRSTPSHHISLWSIHDRPKLSARQNVKTNLITIQKALLKALEGGANIKTLKRMQHTIEAHSGTCHHFLMLFRHLFSFKGIYKYDEKENKIIKLDGYGPKNIKLHDILKFYKFDSTRREFSEVQTKHISLTIIGISIQEPLWSIKTAS